MVKQNQIDLLDSLMQRGSDLSELLTINGDVIGFQIGRNSMEDFDYLGVDDDELSPYIEPQNEVVQTVEELCNHDVLTTFQVLESLVEDQQITFDTVEADFDEFMCFPKMETPKVAQEIELPAAGTSGEKEDGIVPVSPLVKEEIKNKIKLRRMAEGKAEIKVEFPVPEPEKLTDEEEEKRRLRREKNKMAAQKCRSKKRKLADCLEDEIDQLDEKKESLLEEIKKLEDERDNLLDLVKVHSYVCPKMKRGK